MARHREGEGLRRAAWWRQLRRGRQRRRHRGARPAGGVLRGGGGFKTQSCDGWARDVRRKPRWEGREGYQRREVASKPRWWAMVQHPPRALCHAPVTICLVCSASRSPTRRTCRGAMLLPAARGVRFKGRLPPLPLQPGDSQQRRGVWLWGSGETKAADQSAKGTWLYYGFASSRV